MEHDTTDLADRWDRLGRWTGHVRARCPGCGAWQMVAYHPPSGTPPKCRLCRAAPRLVVESDRSLVLNKRPGQVPALKVRRALGLVQGPAPEADPPAADPETGEVGEPGA